jgi:uncharacterized protein YceH (UPF0502 family)
MPAIVFLAVAAPLLLSPAACLSEGQRMAVDVPEGRAPTVDERIGAAVGRLLSGDSKASQEAERELIALDPEERAALAAHARRIPGERDFRWVHVLEANGLLDALTPPLAAGEAVDFRLWQARRGEAAVAMKVTEQLAELARRDPSPLIERLQGPGPGRDLLALALGTAQARTALPSVAALYRGPSSLEERRAAAEAIARILGEARRPRADADDVERASVAAKILREVQREKNGDAPREVQREESRDAK